MQNGRILIGKPYVETDESSAFLKSDVVFPDDVKTVFFSVPRAYEQAFAVELADCFVAAALPWCMRMGLDIESEMPVSRSILHSLKTRLIPGMTRHSEAYHAIDILAEPSDRVYANAGHVGLCWSAGCDSFYTYMTHLDAQDAYKPTHLLNINAGVYEEPDIGEKFRQTSEKCIGVAAAFGLKALNMDTNLHRVFPLLYLSVCAERLAACLLAIQKELSTGLVSSSYDLGRLKYEDDNAGFYELIIQDALSNQNISLFAPGAEVTRLEKIRRLSDFEPAQKMLHVCVRDEINNCSACGKCIRVMTALDALGTLDRFGAVFDLQTFREHRDEYWGHVVYRAQAHLNMLCADVLTLLRQSGRSPGEKALIRARMLAAVYKASNAHRRKMAENEDE